MRRLSEEIAKLENRWLKKARRWRSRHPGSWKLYALLGLMAWYFYGMFINSVRFGIQQTFDAGSRIADVWTANPFLNLIAPFTPTGIGVTAALVTMGCLLTRKGFQWLSGYHPVKDKRGFDILPDGTHGSSRFMNLREMEQILDVGRLDELSGTVYGKYKEDPLDDDMYADYIASSVKQVLPAICWSLAHPKPARAGALSGRLFCNASSGARAWFCPTPKTSCLTVWPDTLRIRDMKSVFSTCLTWSSPIIGTRSAKRTTIRA